MKILVTIMEGMEMGIKGIGLKMDLEKVLDMTGSVFAIILTNIGAIKNEPVIIFLSLLCFANV